MTWRQQAARIVADTLKEHRGASWKEVRAALTDAYPFGARCNYPYKVWLDECLVQLRSHERWRPYVKHLARSRETRRRRRTHPRQKRLFGDA